MLGYVISAAAAAGLVTAGYHTMAPRSQLYGRTFIGRHGSRQLALTFDDGPNDPHTLKLLEVLARHDVRATFFVLGKFVVQRPEILREVARGGHEIGNHTYSHPNLIFATQLQVAQQIRDCEQAISDALGLKTAANTGSFDSDCACDRQNRAITSGAVLAQDDSKEVRLFRPPFGGRTPGVLRAVRRLGYVPVMWNVTALDWKRKSAAEVETIVVREVRGGDVILMHDGGHGRIGVDRSRSVLAADRLLTRLKGEGYQFVTVGEMMNREIV